MVALLCKRAIDRELVVEITLCWLVTREDAQGTLALAYEQEMATQCCDSPAEECSLAALQDIVKGLLPR